MFVLAEVVCGAGSVPYATLVAHGVLQKIHSKQIRLAQDFAYERGFV